MILYHPMPLLFHFLNLLLTFLLLPTEKMSENYSYRTFPSPMFLLRTVGKKPKPQADINYRSFILEFLL